MGNIASVLIKSFILKKTKKLFSLSALYFKDFFRFNPFQTDFDTSHTGSSN